MSLIMFQNVQNFLNVMNKYKVTSVQTDTKQLIVTIEVYNDNEVISAYGVTLPFCVVPPQIAHQIASSLVMANSYLVDDEKSDK